MPVIHVSDVLAKRLQAAAANYGEDMNNYAVAKLEQVLDTEDTEAADTEADDDLIAALREGIADANAGRTVSLDEMRHNALLALAAHRSKL